MLIFINIAILYTFNSYVLIMWYVTFQVHYSLFSLNTGFPLKFQKKLWGNP